MRVSLFILAVLTSANFAHAGYKPQVTAPAVLPPASPGRAASLGPSVATNGPLRFQAPPGMIQKVAGAGGAGSDFMFGGGQPPPAKPTQLKPQSGPTPPVAAPGSARPQITQPTPGQGQPKTPPPSGATGPAGSALDCNIPAGPIAYAIKSPTGAGGRSCGAKSIVVGYKGSFSSLPEGVTGMGYINPRLETPGLKNEFPGNTYAPGDEWNEPVYRDYSSPGAVSYITMQVKHWKEQGRLRRPNKQTCVAVDIDNCDVIGADNYGKVLDVVDDLNRKEPDVQIRVFIKNPQNAGCGRHMRRPVAIGAFMEELTASEFQNLVRSRPNTNQLLLFARGNRRNSGHISLDAIARSGVPNTAVSFDENGSYGSIDRCTYTPNRDPSTIEVGQDGGNTTR